MLGAESTPSASSASSSTQQLGASSAEGLSGQRQRIAAIDIGTNSTHLLVASVDTTLRTFSIVQAEKSTTRLGERDPESGELTAEAMQRAATTTKE